MKAFGYSIGLNQGLKVMALLTVSLFVILTGLFLIVATHDIDFLVAAFEVTSAFGTVGLSQGATGELDTFGRIIICAIMFLGRLGPLTLGFFLSTKSPARVKYPEGSKFESAVTIIARPKLRNQNDSSVSDLKTSTPKTM